MKVLEALEKEIKKQIAVNSLMKRKEELVSELNEVKKQLRKLIQR
jgi:hypothetical protein